MTAKTFAGYCDPTEVFDYIRPTETISEQDIQEMRSYIQNSPYGKALTSTYAAAESDTAEVAYFIEQVTGHVVPDLRSVLASGLCSAIAEAKQKESTASFFS